MRPCVPQGTSCAARLGISAAGLSALARGCGSRLERLTADHCRRLAAEGWETLAAEAQRLVWVSGVLAGGLDDATVRGLVRGCADTLRDLRLGPSEHHPELTRDAMEELRAAHPMLRITGGPKASAIKKRRR